MQTQTAAKGEGFYSYLLFFFLFLSRDLLRLTPRPIYLLRPIYPVGADTEIVDFLLFQLLHGKLIFLGQLLFLIFPFL